MADTCPTVNIVAPVPEEQGPFVIINEADFDAQVHELYVEPADPEPKAKKSKGGEA